MVREVRKIGAVVPISRAIAIDYGIVEPTAEEAAERAESTRLAEFDRKAAWETYRAAKAALAEIPDELTRHLLDLHMPVGDYRVTCDGCDVDGYDSEQPEWPCRTVQTIAAHYDIELPEGWLLWRPAKELS